MCSSDLLYYVSQSRYLGVRSRTLKHFILKSHMASNKKVLMEDCVKELAARLLSRVIKRTPVKEGTLRRGWQIDDNKNINVVKRGGEYRCSIYNSVNYALT